jgi:uridine kinase
MNRAEALRELAAVITEILLPHPTRVAVDGRDGAGKTMLADELAVELRAHGRNAIRASVDGFHNPRAIRYYRGKHSPEGYFRDSYNYDAMHESLLDPLGPYGSRDYRTAAFDWRMDAPAIAPLRRAQPDDILIVDGIFLMRPELSRYWDFRIFVDVRVAEAMQRRNQRDGSSMDPSAESNARYIGGQKIYFEECDPQSAADVIVDNNDLKSPSLSWNQR